MNWTRTLVLSVVMALFMSGCGTTPVADDVSQREANEIVALLSERGIPATLVKGRGSKSRYTVLVGTAKFAEAAAILSRLGLPSDKKASFQELTASSGIIPASREVEALRIDRATASEIEELLRAEAGIAGVSALVRFRTLEGKGDPTATVVIQKRPGGVINVQEIRDITARAVPGLRAEDVLVSLSEASSDVSSAGPLLRGDSDGMVSFLAVSRVPATEYRRHVLLFVALSFIVGLLAGLGGYLMGQFNWIHRQTNGTGATTSHSWLGGIEQSHEKSEVDSSTKV